MKWMYKTLFSFIEFLLIKLHFIKVWVNEWVAVISKYKMYSEVVYSDEEADSFKKYWVGNYGRLVSNRWHRLYQSINGVYNAQYFPDILFSTKLELRLNNIQYSRFYSDKGLTELLYGSVPGVKFPRTILLKSSGFFYDGQRRVVSAEVASELLEKEGDIVVKPIVGGSSGKGVLVLEEKGRSKSDYSRIVDGYKDNYIVQAKLRAHPAYSAIYPSSINTIRLITYLVAGEVRHAPLCLRVGVGGEKVDNIHAGGLVVGVSDTGILKEFAYQLGYCNSKTKYTHHPDTKICFKDYKLPGTLEMIDVAMKLHGKTPHLGIVSWDFMYDDESGVVLVEGNYSGQSVWFPQIVHGKPLFGEDTNYMLGLIRK